MRRWRVLPALIARCFCFEMVRLPFLVDPIFAIFSSPVAEKLGCLTHLPNTDNLLILQYPFHVDRESSNHPCHRNDRNDYGLGQKSKF